MNESRTEYRSKRFRKQGKRVALPYYRKFLSFLCILHSFVVLLLCIFTRYVFPFIFRRHIAPGCPNFHRADAAGIRVQKGARMPNILQIEHDGLRAIDCIFRI